MSPRQHLGPVDERGGAAAQGVAAMPPPSPSFVGRERERTRLAVALGETARSRGGLYLVTGEPGIGKTRLCEELEALARARAAAVLWGRCWKSEGAPTYWPWIQVIRAHLRAGGSLPGFVAALGSAADDLAVLIPELAALFGERTPTEAGAAARWLQDPAARFRLADAIVTFLRVASAARPLLVVLEDLHDADAPSLELLRFAAREVRDLPVLIVATYRDADVRAATALAPLVGELARSATTLTLRGLSEDEVAELVSQRLGEELPLGVVIFLHERTEGNPLFASELAYDLAVQAKRGTWNLATVDLPLPHAIADIMLGRLELISPAAREILAAASIAGRTFELALVAPLCAWNEAGCLSAMEEGQRAGLVTTGRGAGTFAFTHALVRAAIYRHVPAGRRAELHLAFAEAAEASFGVGPEPRFAELAHHFALGAAVGGRDQLARYEHLAGEQAAAQGAFEDAERHLRRALDATRDDDQRARTWLVLGDVLRSRGDAVGAVESFVHAAELARTLRRPTLLAAAALGVGRMPGSPMRTSAIVTELAVEALAQLSDDEPAARAMLHAHLSIALLFTPHREECVRHGRQSLALARSLGDPAALAAVLPKAHDALWTPDNLDERLAMAMELDTLASQLGRRDVALEASQLRMFALLEGDDVAGAEQELAVYARIAGEVRDPLHLWWADVHGAMFALLHGRLEEAEARADHALELGTRHGVGYDVRAHHLLACCQLRREQGRLAELAPATAAMAAAMPRLVGWKFLQVLALQEAGEVAAARPLLDGITAQTVAALPRDLLWLGNLTLLADVAIAAGDAGAARAVHDLLAPFETRNATHGRGTVAYGPVALTLGRLAVALADPERARRYLARAIDSAERSKSPLAVQRAQAVLATLDGPGGRAELVEDDATDDRVTMTLEGNLWRIRRGGRELRVRDSKGVRYLAELVRRPGHELHVAQLVGEVGGDDAAAAGEPGVLDAETHARYRARFDALQDVLDDADRRGDDERGARARAELEALGGEVARLLGGVDGEVRASAQTERLRQSVTKRIREAIRKIGDGDATLGAHLDRAVRTGTVCAYLRPVRTGSR